MSQVNLNGGTAAPLVDNGESISDDDFEYDDCDDYMEDSLPDGSSTLMNNNNTAHPSFNNTRGPYERAWTTDATRALIHIRGPLEGRFTEGRQKRTALWLQCTRQLQRMGYRYSAAKVQKKWHNILITYNKNLNKKYLSGYVHWEFFEEMFKYLEGKKANFDGQQQQQQQQQQHQHQQQQQAQTQQQSSQQDTQQQYQPQIKIASKQSLNSKHSNNQRQSLQSQAVAHYVDPQTLLQPQVQLDTKSNDDYDDDSLSIPELRQPKIEYDEDNAEQSMTGHHHHHQHHHQPLPLDITQGNNFEAILNNNKHDERDYGHNFHGFEAKYDTSDTSWWKDYFERKLQMEQEKMTMQHNMHRDLMQYHKTCLVQQEKIERIKIDAINNLTTALQKLVEAKHQKS